MQLQNSTILITGGTSGIGLEFVKQLLDKGVAQLIVTGRNKQKLDVLSASYSTVNFIQSDVSKEEEI